MNKLFCISILLISFSMTTMIEARLVHSERSLYRNIMVDDSATRRCMIFGRRTKHPDLQSCISFKDPEHLEFSYTKLVLAGFALQPKPKSILIIGLGGGTLPLTLEHQYPNAKIDTVEIDQAVINVAKQWFSFKESEHQKVHVADGRVFVKRQNRFAQHYDVIILDAFNGDYIPEHLMTKEFLSEINTLLSCNGLLIANTFSKNKLYDHESQTYRSVFGRFHYIHSNKSGNRIIYAKKGLAETNLQPLIFQSLADQSFTQYFKKIGVDFNEFQKRISSKIDWNMKVKPLSDQFSPANLLNQD